MRRFTLLFTLAILSHVSIAQEIKFKISGVKDTTVHLVKYNGQKLLYADTAEIKNGVVKFDGSKHEHGMMAFLFPNQSYFDFLHTGEDIFIETKFPDYNENIKVKKSRENQVFYQYIHYLKTQQDDAQELMKRKETASEEASANIDKQLQALGKNVKQYQEKLVAENKGTLVAAVVKMSTDIEIPEQPKDEDGKPLDPSFAYTYFRDHFFDNIDFNDDRLANTSVIEKKLEYFLSNKMLVQHPDTLIKYVGNVIDQIPTGNNMYKLFVIKATSTFEKSNIMGMDKAKYVFVDRYYCALDEAGKPKAYWLNKEKLDDLCENTKVNLRLVQGERPPNIILTDTTNQNWYDFYSLKSEYTVLYFWDPGCGHCKKETPKLEKLYTQKLKDRNVEVFAVGKATGDDFKDWKKFIKEKKLSFINVGLTEEIYQIAKTDIDKIYPSKTTAESINYQTVYDIYSTPRVWILDKDKKIIGKGLSVSQIETFLDQLQGFEDAEKIITETKKK